MWLKIVVVVILIAGMAGACNRQTTEAEGRKEELTNAVVQKLDFGQLDRVLGLKGTRQNGEYKLAIPQSELSVSVDGFRIIPPMGLTSWAAFAPSDAGAVVMGDLIFLEDEIGPVQKAMISSGLMVSGLHNHFVRDKPKVMFMHIHGRGPAGKLADSVQRTLDKVREVRQAKELKKQSVAPVQTSFDPKTVANVLGHSGEMSAGVYKVTIGRPDVRLLDHGVRVSTFMGFNTWMAFQGTAEKAAVSGDFAMLEHEVPAVMEALAKNNIEGVALHNHMTTEQPRIFFVHFWGVGPVEGLARGLKEALNQTGTSGHSRNTRITFEDVPAGGLLAGWQVGATHPGNRLAEWVVQKDSKAASGDQVLAIKISGSDRGTFNLIWTGQIRLHNGVVAVKVRAGEGRIDQGGGPIWRVKDANNYYIARWNPLENNFRVYYVKDGKRIQLDTADVKVPADQWHTIRIEHEGNHITGYLDGKKLLEATDATFAGTGGVGLWTKADAASFFDDFEVQQK